MKIAIVSILLALAWNRCNSVEFSLRTENQARVVRKRADDNDPLENVVMQLAALVSLLQAKVDVQSRHVAFLANFPTGIGPVSGPYKFSQVVFNDGNGYDPITGIFTAPFSGTYVFTAQFFASSHQTSRPVWDMKLNGNQIIRLAMETTSDAQLAGEESTSTSLVLKLNAGDSLWFEAAGHEYNLWGPGHTFFAGALLYSQ